jgi:ribosomal protein RSM22 (predicted rRNA methylase)
MQKQAAELAEELCQQLGFGRLREAVEALQDTYRDGRSSGESRVDARRFAAAYLAVRFPATYAANLAVARATKSRCSHLAPSTLLDLGAGCAAAALAFCEVWGELDVSAVERMPEMVELGRRLLPNAIWRTTTFRQQERYAPHDFVLCSYAFGEDEAALEANLSKAWEATRQMLVVVEAGTPRGFDLILRARKILLSWGGTVAAPCPSGEACPVTGDDWCHFAMRLNRSSLHRRLKGGALCYEDEKYSYIAMVRGPLPQSQIPGAPRILRHPAIEPGRVRMELCVAPKKATVQFDRRDRTALKAARKLTWGDVCDIRPVGHAAEPSLSDREIDRLEGAQDES